MTITIEFPQMTAFTALGSLERLVTFTTPLDRFASHNTRKQARVMMMTEGDNDRDEVTNDDGEDEEEENDDDEYEVEGGISTKLGYMPKQRLLSTSDLLQ